ncbi:hypothetical protein [Neorhodopirellula pilleata]|uniref:Uncharacterized protein n=1 Tax=Neorhodopirellula pilleata TaxID=2714738 RepID=A0A5C5ZXH4_9BACT|nr:hypothetical protein [Neorhodopirellula pilleata]TWT91836.1 hypothetical protein Pla100_48740 [Neorhodopirellula pilleata]
MTFASRLPIAPVPDHWCWIGEDDSAYLRGLIDWLKCRRNAIDQANDYHVQLLSVSSTKKIQKLLAKTKADVFVWSIDREGIATLIREIVWLKAVQPNAFQIAAGPASPAERNAFFEAGVRLHIEHPTQWHSSRRLGRSRFGVDPA